MKQYTTDNPSFSDSVYILETTDTNHADNFNEATKQLYQNTMYNKAEIDKLNGFSYDAATETLIIPATVGSVVGETLVLS